MEFDINPNELSLQGPDGMQLVQILRKLIVAIDGSDEPEPTETSGLYYCTYGTTTSAQIAQAITEGLLPVCLYGGRYYYLAYRQVNIFTFASVDQTQLILYRIKCNGSNWSFNSSYLQSLLDFDYTPTEGSTNPVTSGGVWTAIQQGGGGSDIDPYQQYPAMDGTASPGSSDDYARGDHVHPTDTSRAAASEITRIDAALATKADAATMEQDIEDAVDDWLSVQAPSIGTLSYSAKRALLTLLHHVAYDHPTDVQYYNALENELFPDATVESITAVFTQGSATIFDTDSLDTLRQYLVVTATFSDSTTATVTDYTLSGTLSAGTSTITVSYGGKTDTFSVTVTSTALPTGYTKYDYLQKKTDVDEQKKKANFIILNDQPDMNVLSLEVLVAKKSGIYNSSGFLGVRNESGWLTSYSAYGTATAGEYEGVSGYGIQIALRGVHITGEHELTETPSKIEIINPSTSPITLKANDSTIATLPWETTFTIPHGLFILTNGQYNSASNMTLNCAARIGHIILRKNTGECAGYYIPCVHDGKIGVYDLVSEAFYTASTASAVTISNSGCLYSVGNWS